MMTKIFLILLITVSSNIIPAQNSKFIEPFKLGSYYEYLYIEAGASIRYNAKIVREEKRHGKTYKIMDIYNEPPMVHHWLYFYFDIVSLNIYGEQYSACPDSTGNILEAGFDLPVGYIWNQCQQSIYFRSEIITNAKHYGFLGYSDSLRLVERKDTAGFPIDGKTYYSYLEKFGYVKFSRDYGSPLMGGPYSKLMVGAIIDGVTYGSILLDVNQISSEIPNDFKLEQNFPNPFNPSTVIKFSLQKSSHVSLKVYDQLGKEVSGLVNEKKSAGTYQYVFNAVNIPSGMYFYTLQADDYIETKKMLLLK